MTIPRCTNDCKSQQKTINIIPTPFYLNLLQKRKELGPYKSSTMFFADQTNLVENNFLNKIMTMCVDLNIQQYYKDISKKIKKKKYNKNNAGTYLRLKNTSKGSKAVALFF